MGKASQAEEVNKEVNRAENVWVRTLADVRLEIAKSQKDSLLLKNRTGLSNRNELGGAVPGGVAQCRINPELADYPLQLAGGPLSTATRSSPQLLSR